MQTSVQRTVILATLALDSGGSNDIAATLFRRWPRNGDKVRVCVAVRDAVTNAPDISADWIIGRIPTLRNIVSVCLSLSRMMKALRPGVIVSHGYGLNHAFILAKLLHLVRAKVIVVEHGDLNGRFATQSFYRQALSRHLTRFLYRRADRVVYVSEVLAERATTGRMGIESAIVAIPNFIDHRAFRQRSQVRTSAHSPLVLRALTRPWILWVGRLSPEKNPAFLLDIMSEYFEGNAGSCLILGDGPMRSELERNAALKGLSTSVHFFGHMSDPAWFIGQADVIVLTSHTEGRPLVLLEAMACGTAILAPDHIAGVTEMLKDYERARLHGISNRSVWSGAIAELISLGAGQPLAAQSEAAFMGLNVGEPDAECMVQAYVSLVDEVVGGKS